jgi:hypothetical protein
MAKRDSVMGMDATVQQQADSKPRVIGRPFPPGNPFAAKGGRAPRRVDQYRSLVEDAETPERVGEVIAKMHDQAMDGDTSAAKVYLSYTLGSPHKTADIQHNINATTQSWTLGDLLELLRLKKELESGQIVKPSQE